MSMKWFERNSAALQAAGSIVTAFVAVAALAGVKMQVDASYAVQREQSAKEIYREFLNISIANPDFADPGSGALKATPRAAAYASYVEYMLYTAEQVLQASPDWKSVFEGHMEMHAEFLCAIEDWNGYADSVESLARAFKANRCK
jgi:hypothetical protein